MPFGSRASRRNGHAPKPTVPPVIRRARSTSTSPAEKGRRSDMTIRVRFDEVTDVLVVGSGLSGLMSAIAADETGASVSIVTPKRLGRDSSSAMSTGGLAASFEDHGDDSALHAADTLRSGQGVSDKRLVDLLCHGSSDAVRRARSLGGRFRQTAGGELRDRKS